MTVTQDRLFTVSGAYNIRDLGGYSVPGGTTTWRRLLRADGLHHLDEAGISALVDHGVGTVIDLRSDIELEIHPNPFARRAGVNYRNIPLFGGLAPIDIISAPADARFDMAERYREAIDTCQDRIVDVLSTVADARSSAVLFHCTAGKDRTGIIAALLLSIAGVDEDTIIADYALTAEVAQPLLAILREKSIERGAQQHMLDGMLASPPETMRTTLDHIARTYGGVDRYLDGIGIAPQTIERIRTRFVERIAA